VLKQAGSDFHSGEVCCDLIVSRSGIFLRYLDDNFSVLNVSQQQIRLFLGTANTTGQMGPQGVHRYPFRYMTPRFEIYSATWTNCFGQVCLEGAVVS